MNLSWVAVGAVGPDAHVMRLPAAVGLVTVSVTHAPVAPVGTPLVPVTGMVTVAPAATGVFSSRSIYRCREDERETLASRIGLNIEEDGDVTCCPFPFVGVPVG